MRVREAALSMLFLVLPAGQGGAVVPGGSSPLAPVVAELFTSQGCDSCPPAEELLGELSRRPDVLALAFHVTYWDDLGWRDRFSFSDADARQYRYASVLGRRGVYTPQLVVNGGREVVGSNRGDVLRAIGTAQPAAGFPLAMGGGTVQAELLELGGGCDCELVLLGVLPSTQTAVASGENKGRVLQEFNVVRKIYPLAGWNGRAARRVHSLPAFPTDASLFVLLAQRRSDARILAVGVTRASPGD